MERAGGRPAFQREAITLKSQHSTQSWGSLYLPSGSTSGESGCLICRQGFGYFRLASICNQGALRKVRDPCMCTGGVCSSICAALPALRGALVLLLSKLGLTVEIEHNCQTLRNCPHLKTDPFNTHSCSRRNPALS